MNWSLYLDDERVPKTKPKYGEEWVVCRSARDALTAIRVRGMPTQISFDHDLGIDEIGNIATNGYEFAKFLVSMDFDLPENFEFNVHSANPVGAKNITFLMRNYILHKEENIQ